MSRILGLGTALATLLMVNAASALVIDSFDNPGDGSNAVLINNGCGPFPSPCNLHADLSDQTALHLLLVAADVQATHSITLFNSDCTASHTEAFDSNNQSSNVNIFIPLSDYASVGLSDIGRIVFTANTND